MVSQESVRVILVRLVERIAPDQQPRSLPDPQRRMRRIRQRTGVGSWNRAQARGAPLPGAVVAETVSCA